MSKFSPCCDDWSCECSQCDKYWDWMSEQETKDIGTLQATKEYDEEYEANRDGSFEVDGW